MVELSPIALNRKIALTIRVRISKAFISPCYWCGKRPNEINNWKNALNCSYDEFPKINSTKSLIGHTLGAAGAIECVASVLQLSGGFIHGSKNCEDLHFKLEQFSGSIVHETTDVDLNIVAKASFGFGDVNACLILKKWDY